VVSHDIGKALLVEMNFHITLELLGGRSELGQNRLLRWCAWAAQNVPK
jgi:hypothetical protein